MLCFDGDIDESLWAIIVGAYLNSPKREFAIRCNQMRDEASPAHAGRLFLETTERGVVNLEEKEHGRRYPSRYRENGGRKREAGIRVVCFRRQAYNVRCISGACSSTMRKIRRPKTVTVSFFRGHAAPALYATLAEAGYFPKEELATLRKLHSRLQGHPDCRKLPGVEASTGLAQPGPLLSLPAWRSA